MKNNLKIVIVVLVVIIIGIFVYFYKTKPAPINEETPIVTEGSIKGCYIARLAKDVYTLTILSQSGESFEGTLNFKNFEKDSSSGTYKGTYKDGILLGDYSFQSEGMFSVMQVIFKKSGNSFVRGYGDTIQEGTRFADINKITYDSSYVFETSTDCTTIIDSPVACTQEAKLCPDGSAVGRTGPNCEFSLCPGTGTTSKKSGITGTVTLGPTCPVERIPPDPNCAPKPYPTSINIMKTGSIGIIKTIQSNSSGIFSVDLAPGAYTLQAQGGNLLPRCSEVSIVVESGQYTTAKISCDTGIR